MATYKYTLKNSDTGATYKYNITPDFTSNLKAGDTITISGQVSGCNIKIAKILFKLVVCTFGNESSGDRLFSNYIAKSVAKGGTATFTITGTISSGLLDRVLVRSSGSVAAFAVFEEYDSTDNGTGCTTAKESQSYAITKTINAPTVTLDSITDSFVLVDGTKPYDTYGGYIYGKSNLTFKIKVSADTDYTIKIKASGTDNNYQQITDYTPVSKRYTYWNDLYAGGSFNVPNWKLIGFHTVTVEVTDAIGQTATATQTILVHNYYKPRFEVLEVVRYGYELTEDESPQIIQKDDGLNAWLNAIAQVAPIQGLPDDSGNKKGNNWSVDINYSPIADSSNVLSKGTISGVYAGEAWEIVPNDIVLNVSEDVDVFSGITFENTVSYEITATIRDNVGGVATATAILQKATVYFKVEKFGVGVGMSPSGSEDGLHSFEVADNYLSVFHGGIHGVNVYSLGEVKTGGVWWDGRPIYRNVVKIPALAANRTSTDNVAVVCDEISWLIDFYGTVRRSNNMWYPLTFRAMGNVSVYAVDVYIKKDGGVVARTGTSTEITEGYITCFYTKLSDPTT